MVVDTSREACFLRPGTSDEEIYKEIFVDKRHKPDDFDRLSVVIDVGAYTGMFALDCLSRGASHVYCYEPNVDNFKVLAKQQAKYPDKITINNVAVTGNTVGKVKLSRPGSHYHREDITNYADCSVVVGDMVYEVAGVRMCDVICSVLERHCWVDLLKVDCEGAEWEIFKYTDFSKVNVICLEYHMHGEGGRDIVHLVQKVISQGFYVVDWDLHPKGYADAGTIWFVNMG